MNYICAMVNPPVILSIAGYDPSSGAGVTADVKTAAANGCFAVTCVTALTVQSTQGVREVRPVEPKLVKQTLADLGNDFEFAAVRIGMLGSSPVAAEVAQFLEAVKLKNVVLDPIVRSTSGAELIDAKGAEQMRDRLLRLADVITPNIDEAAALTGMKVTTTAEMKAAAMRLHEMGAHNVVITGGHLSEAIDVLSMNGTANSIEEFRSQMVASKSTHGTGCAFATALACYLAVGRPLRQAVIEAKVYVREAIAKAYAMGKGIGPVNHLWRLEQR